MKNLHADILEEFSSLNYRFNRTAGPAFEPLPRSEIRAVERRERRKSGVCTNCGKVNLRRRRSTCHACNAKNVRMALESTERRRVVAIVFSFGQVI